MEVITLLGKLYGPCELCSDKYGNNYIRFKLYTIRKDAVYRCYSYDTSFADLQDRDTVCLVGDVVINIYTDEDGKSRVIIDVYVKNLERIS